MGVQLDSTEPLDPPPHLGRRKEKVVVPRSCGGFLNKLGWYCIDLGFGTSTVYLEPWQRVVRQVEW